MRVRSAVAPALVIFALLAVAPSAAQDDLFAPPDKEEQQPNKPPPKPTLPGCALITVTAEPLRVDGLRWDLGKSTEAPDILIEELTTASKVQCAQIWSCSLTVQPVSRELKLRLSDDDIDASDPIGQGNCAIGKTCRIGQAKVSIARC